MNGDWVSDWRSLMIDDWIGQRPTQLDAISSIGKELDICLWSISMHYYVLSVDKYLVQFKMQDATWRGELDRHRWNICIGIV